MTREALKEEDVARRIATILENEQDMRVLLKNAERKKGEWIKHSDNFGHSSYFCSRCGTQEGKQSGFCPNVGADMRGEKE